MRFVCVCGMKNTVERNGC